MIMNLKPKENLKLFLPEFTVKPPNLIHGSGLRFYNHIAWENQLQQLESNNDTEFKLQLNPFFTYCRSALFLLLQIGPNHPFCYFTLSNGRPFYSLIRGILQEGKDHNYFSFCFAPIVNSDLFFPIHILLQVVRMQLTVPQRPALPYVDPTKLDEIRRTVHIGHLPKDVSLSPFFL